MQVLLAFPFWAICFYLPLKKILKYRTKPDKIQAANKIQAASNIQVADEIQAETRP